MKLYFFPIAPNPTKVRLYLAEKAAAGCTIPLEQIVVNLGAGEQRSESHRARNPFETLPVLETDAGQCLIESLAMIEYLEELFPEPSMYGSDPEARAVARQIERIADLGVLVPIAWIVHTTDSPLGFPANPAVAEHYRARLSSKLRYLETLLADGRAFMAGDRVTVADCTLASAFQFGRFGKLDFTTDYPQLQRWEAAYRRRTPTTAILTL